MAPLTELSLFSGVGGGGYSPHNICSASEQSAMSNGTRTQLMSSKLASGTDTCAMPPSGMTLLLSTGDRGLDLWMLSLRASRANHSAQQERDLPRTTRVTGGQLSSASFAKYDLNTRSWRMYPVLSLSHISDEYLGNWPKRVSILNRIAFLRRRSARTTSANGSGLLPTPTVSHGSYQRSPGGKKRYSLHGMARHGNWKDRELIPTPTVNDAHNSTMPASQATRASLVGYVMRQMFQTPNTRGIDASKSGRKRAKENGTFVTHSGGMLNPTWVEWLMNWPLGWTSLEPLRKDYFDDWKFRTQGGAENFQSKEVRVLWWDEDPSETPYRPQPNEQQSEERQSSLPNLPQGRAHENRRLGTWQREAGDLQNMQGNVPTKAKPPINRLQETQLLERTGEIISRTAMAVQNRVDRLRTIGNGQVPAVVVEAWLRHGAGVEK